MTDDLRAKLIGSIRPENCTCPPFVAGADPATWRCDARCPVHGSKAILAALRAKMKEGK